MSDKAKAWVAFAAGAAANPSLLAAHVPACADYLVREYEARFGEAAYFLEGQRNCNTCKQPLDADYVVSNQALKYCSNECMNAVDGNNE